MQEAPCKQLQSIASNKLYKLLMILHFLIQSSIKMLIQNLTRLTNVSIDIFVINDVVISQNLKPLSSLNNHSHDEVIVETALTLSILFTAILSQHDE